MSKKRPPIVDPNQMSLLELLSVQNETQAPGAFDIETRLKEEASLALRRCRLSRYEVAAKMSEMLGREVTKSMLDNRTAESKEDQMWPAAWLAPFAVVTGHYEQIKLINKQARLPIPDTEKLIDMEIARRRQTVAEEERELQDLMRLKDFIANGARKS